MNKLFCIILFVFCLGCCNSIGQSVSIYLKKVGEKGHLLIKINSPKSGIHYYDASCFAKMVSTLSNGIKLQLIKKLLEYEYDTTICYIAVKKLSPLVIQLKKPSSDSFRIQVDALILINLIALASDVFVYSPYPVLVSKSTGQEITNQQEEVSNVYAVYRKWLNNLSNNNFKNYTPPNLSEINIGWFGGAFEKKVYKIPNKWSKSFDCIDL